MAPLVSTDWLVDKVDDVKVIDASWRMPGATPARLDYETRHIPGAAFFDIDEITDKSIDLPHMLPAPEVFAEAVGAMGVSNHDQIVVYDDAGLFSSPRVWWTFRVMGHERVAVLDGGLRKWQAEGRRVSTSPAPNQPVPYEATLKSDLAVGHHDMRRAMGRNAPQIVDARGSDRFCGKAPEPREGLLSGAMPGAFNVPFDLLVSETGELAAPQQIRRIFENAGVDLEEPIITTCGSGVTAALLALALERLGHRQWSLYDGSWAEWGKEENDRVAYPVIGRQD